MISSPETGGVSRNEALQAAAERCFVRATRRAANLVTRVYNGHLKVAGLEATQFWTLCVIEEGSALSLSDLARVLSVEKSTLKRSLDLMARDGLIAPEQGRGRRVIHRLTPTGREKLEAAMPLWKAAQAEVERLLPQARAEEIRADLRLLRSQARAVLEGKAPK